MLNDADVGEMVLDVVVVGGGVAAAIMNEDDDAAADVGGRCVAGGSVAGSGCGGGVVSVVLDLDLGSGSVGGSDDVVRVVFELMLLVLPRRAPEINASAITTSPGPGRILTSGSAVLAWCRPA